MFAPNELPCDPETLVLLPSGCSAASISEAASDERIARFLEWAPHRTVEDGQRFLDLCRTELEEFKGAHYGIRTVTNQILGVTALTNIDWQGREAESTTWLIVSAWGTGVSRRVRLAMLRLAFTTFG